MNLPVEDNCHTQFQNLKYRKKDIRYIIYKIQHEKIMIEKLGQKGQNFASFVASLPENQYRFGVYDYQLTTPDNRHVTKLIFVSWNPDSSPLKGRVLYATSKESFKKYLDLNTKDYTMCSKDEKIEEEVIKDLSK